MLTLKLLEAGVHPAAIGMIDTIGAVSGILGSLVAPSLIMRIPTGLLAVALFLNPAGNASISSYMAAITPDRLQGRANSALGFAATVFMPLAPVTGGLLLAAWGGQQAMLAAAALAGLSVLPLVLSRETRRLPTPDQWLR